MDPITHGLAGYVIAKTGLTRDTGRLGVAAGVIASLFPDIDSLIGPLIGTEFTVKYHRGLTNSVFLAFPVAVFFAWLFNRFSGKRRYWTFFLIWILEMSVHNFLDLVTSYGTMILSPFSRERFALDWVFIIDFFLTGIFLSFIIARVIWKSKSTLLARGCLVLAAVYISLCAGNHLWALSLSRGYAERQGLNAVNIASLPQPLSPFHWANFVVTEDTVYRGLVNLIGQSERKSPAESNLFSRVWAQYQPMQKLSYDAHRRFDQTPWAQKAMGLEGVDMFLWFARFPVVRYGGTKNGHHRVTFFDLRFGGVPGKRPFLYEVIFDAEGDVLFQGFQRDHSSKVLSGID